MNRYIDYKRLKERVPIMDIVARYGLSLKPRGESFTGACPLCGGEETSTRFSVTPSKGVNGAFKCFSCNADGNAIELVAAIEGSSTAAAAVTIAEWFGITDCDYTPKRTRRRAKPTPEPSASDEAADDTPDDKLAGTSETDYFDPNDLAEVVTLEVERHNPRLAFDGLKGLDPDHPELIELGLSELCREFEAGFHAGRGLMRGRLAVPVHNRHGQPVAYCGIALDGRDDRLKWPAAEKFDPTLELFNLHRAIATPLFESDGLIIVEDILDALVVYGDGNEHVIATMGGALSEQQLLKLRRLDNPSRQLTLLWCDTTTPAFKDMVAKLARFSWVHVGSPDRDVAIRDLDEDEVHALLS